MSKRYVVLRSVETPRTRSATPGAVATDAPSSPIAVELEEMAPARAAEVARHRDVRAVAPVVPMKLVEPVPLDVTADPLQNGSTWGVKAVKADTSPFTGAGVVVSVLDTGIDPNHAAFAGMTLERKNFTTAGEDDQNGHGTHCAGTIFGRDVDGTRIGVAPGVERALIGKVLGPGGGSSDRILEAIEWSLRNGAHIISMSLGIDFPGFVEELRQDGVPVPLATSMALEGYRANVLLFERLAALVEARSAFMQAAILVAAAGNESQRNVHPDFEIAVSPPAVADGIISVAALQPDAQGLTIAPFSNTGARVSGPGVGVLSARAGGGLRSLNGTSMATPHVAGVAALWAQKLRIAGQFASPLFTDRLIGAATMTPLATGFDPPDVGAGIVQAPQD